MDTSADEGYKFTKENFNKAIVECKRKGLTPRILMLTNPNNPLGKTIASPQIKEMIMLAREYNMHTIVDEIYACCVYRCTKTSETFISAASIHDEVHGTMIAAKDVHIVWG